MKSTWFVTIFFLFVFSLFQLGATDAMAAKKEKPPNGGNGQPAAGLPAGIDKDLAITSVNIVYLGEPDINGIPILLPSPYVVVAGRNFDEETLLDILLENVPITIDLDANSTDNMFAFSLPPEFFDLDGSLLDGNYELLVSAGNNDTQTAAYLLSIDASAARNARNLAKEELDRIDADLALEASVGTAQTTADSAVESAAQAISLVEVEAITRDAADQTLADQLLAESEARAAADESLAIQLEAEQAERLAGDVEVTTLLQSEMSLEAASRANADTQLGAAITEEADQRQAGDAAVAGALINEANIRAGEDSRLEMSIADVQQATVAASDLATEVGVNAALAQTRADDAYDLAGKAEQDAAEALEALANTSHDKGKNNTFVGGNSGNPDIADEERGGSNSAFGALSLSKVTSGTSSTAVGSFALQKMTEGFQNTAVGARSLSSTTTGTGNSAMGYLSMFSNIDGAGNTAYGKSTLQKSESGFGNTALGGSAMRLFETGIQNVAVGQIALENLQSGNSNTIVGQGAANSLLNGSNNIVLGSGVLGDSNESNTIRIGRPNIQNRTFIAGVSGSELTENSQLVYVDENGQLGVRSSVSLTQLIEDVRLSAEAATTAAEQATADAWGAQTTADGAIAASGQAIETVEVLSFVVEASSATASTALAEAQTANSNAEQAVQSAVLANETANSAQSSAASATETAESALETANTAESKATAAQDTSSALQIVVASLQGQFQIPDAEFCTNPNGVCYGAWVYFDLETGQEVSENDPAADIGFSKRDPDRNRLDHVAVRRKDGSLWSPSVELFVEVTDDDAATSAWREDLQEYNFDGSGVREIGAQCGIDEGFACASGALLVQTAEGNAYKIGNFIGIDNPADHSTWIPQPVSFSALLLGSIASDDTFLSATEPTSAADRVVYEATREVSARADSALATAVSAETTATSAQQAAAGAITTANSVKDSFFLAGTDQALLDAKQMCELYRRVFSTNGSDQNQFATDACRGQFDWNSAPVAFSETYLIGSNEHSDVISFAKAAGVLKNDIDADGDSLRALPVNLQTNQVSFGSLALSQNGSFQFNVSPNYSVKTKSGTGKVDVNLVTFRYRASDEHLSDLWDGSKSNIVTSRLNLENRAPTAFDDSYSFFADRGPLSATRLEGVIKLDPEDSDPDGDTLQVKVSRAPNKGMLTLGPNGGFDYEPNPGFSGIDSFEYDVMDGFGGYDTATVTITARADRVVFATASRQNADMGGLAGADAICQGQADAGSLEGTYKAWLSDNNTSVKNRFTNSRGGRAYRYVLPTGLVVASDWDQLSSGNLNRPINQNPRGQEIFGLGSVWTGTKANGTQAFAGSDGGFCNNWNQENAAVNDVTVGNLYESDSQWTELQTTTDCSSLRRLYCIQQ